MLPLLQLKVSITSYFAIFNSYDTLNVETAEFKNQFLSIHSHIIFSLVFHKHKKASKVFNFVLKVVVLH
jgi:hypothetical protein